MVRECFKVMLNFILLKFFNFRAICQLHFLELPLRHLIEEIDGKFSGPSSSKGPIGRIITKPSKDWIQPVVNFKPIPISDQVKHLMNTLYPEEYLNDDQLYFMNLWKAVVKGNQSKRTRVAQSPPPPNPLWNKLPGVVHLARWITAATAILRLYCQTRDPSNQLLRLVYYICGCYAPMCFKIKTDWEITNGAPNLHLTYKLAKACLNKKDFLIVERYIFFNSFYAHPENVLLSAIFDPVQKVREKAFQVIQHIRDVRSENPTGHLKIG